MTRYGTNQNRTIFESNPKREKVNATSNCGKFEYLRKNSFKAGNGLPEVSLMLPLCNLLGISVNELLSGERLDETRYYQKAEQNIIAIGAKNKGAEDLLISEYMEKCVLRNFIANSEDIGALQKFYCPNMPIKAIEKNDRRLEFT